MSWTARIGADRAAAIVTRVILRQLHRRPAVGRLCDQIVGEVLQEATARDRTGPQAPEPAGAATLGWSFIGIFVEAIEQSFGAEAIQLVLRTRLRRTGQRVARKDRYHLVAADWFLVMLEDASIDLLTPEALPVLVARPANGMNGPARLLSPTSLSHDAVETRSPGLEAGAGAGLVTAGSVLENTTWRVNVAVLRTATALLSCGHEGNADGQWLEIGPDDRLSLRTAEWGADAEFWIRYKQDFRGQVQAVTAMLSPQGTDLQRSLLMLADGKPLGPDGARALANHGAATYGMHLTMNPDGCVRWVREHASLIAKCAADPLRERWWMSANEPWSFLAFCYEWAAYIDSGRGAAFVSSLPVYVQLPDADPRLIEALLSPLEHRSDAPTDADVGIDPQSYLSGILSAVRANLEAATEANALDERLMDPRVDPLLSRIISDAIMDFRSGSTSYAFAGKIRKVLEQGRRWENLRELLTRPLVGSRAVTLRQACIYLAQVAREVDTTRKRRDRERVVEALRTRADGGDPLARRWLESGLLSTLCVRAAGKAGRANVMALEEHLTDSRERDTAEALFCGPLAGSYRPTIDAVCALLATHIWTALKAAHPRTVEMHTWLRGVARRLVKLNQPISWTTPGSGQFVQQPYYRRVKLGQCKVTIAGKERRPAYYAATTEVCARRQVNRITANVVRSIDAAVVALVVKRATEMGIASLAVAQGGIVGLAADVQDMADCIREISTEVLSSWDVASHLREEWPQVATES